MPSATPVRTFMRTASRYLTEPHPHGRHPVSTPAHRHYNAFYLKRAATTFSIYVPTIGFILGWPVLTAAALKRTGI